ncbi:hypothetical protein D3C81_1665920 [compost metagenome]
MFHFTDAVAHVEAFGFACLVAVECHAHQRLGRQAADEAAALPLRELRAAVDDETGRRNHLAPGHDRGDEFRARVVVGDRAAVVVVAVGNDGVAVVAAALDQVQLVAALRPHLVFPELAVGIEGQAQHAAVTQ